MDKYVNWKSRCITPSRVDNFLKYCTGILWEFGDNSVEFTTDLFIKQLLKIEPPTRQMDAGTALHKALEQAQYGHELNNIVVNDWHINFTINTEIELPTLREIPVCKKYKDILIRGVVDSIDSTSVRDIKTTSSIDLEKYINSLQWQIYLWMTGKHEFIYDIFKISISEVKQSFKVLEYQKVKLYAYDGMEEYILSVLSQYYDILDVLYPQIRAIADAYNIDIDSGSFKKREVSNDKLYIQ